MAETAVPKKVSHIKLHANSESDKIHTGIVCTDASTNNNFSRCALLRFFVGYAATVRAFKSLKFASTTIAAKSSGTLDSIVSSLAPEVSFVLDVPESGVAIFLPSCFMASYLRHWCK